MNIVNLEIIYPNKNSDGSSSAAAAAAAAAAKQGNTSSCLCSTGCKKKIYKSSENVSGVITVYPIPGEQNMNLGGLAAFDHTENIWIQSYYNNVSVATPNIPIPSSK